MVVNKIWGYHLINNTQALVPAALGSLSLGAKALARGVPPVASGSPSSVVILFGFYQHEVLIVPLNI